MDYSEGWGVGCWQGVRKLQGEGVRFNNRRSFYL